jgi:hypothetical protein
MHLAFGSSRQVIEVANIFSALRAPAQVPLIQAIGITPRPAGLSSWVRPTTLQDVEHFDLRASAVVIGRLVPPSYPEKP